MPRASQEMPRLVKFSHLNNRNMADHGRGEPSTGTRKRTDGRTRTTSRHAHPISPVRHRHGLRRRPATGAMPQRAGQDRFNGTTRRFVTSPERGRFGTHERQVRFEARVTHLWETPPCRHPARQHRSRIGPVSANCLRTDCGRAALQPAAHAPKRPSARRRSSLAVSRYVR